MSRARLSRRISSLASVLLCAGGATAGTFTVDDSGGADFTDVPPAIAAAAPGDVLLVRDGTYSSFILEKGLSIVADTGAAPTWGQGFAWIRNLPAGQTASLAGLTIQSVRVQACDGAVQIDDCELKPPSAFLDNPVLSALSVVNCELVVISRSLVRGAGGSFVDLVFPSHLPARGAELFTSTVVVSQCSFVGGGGGSFYKSSGMPGAEAIFAQSTLLMLQDSSVAGGLGGTGWGVEPDLWFTDGGPGAPAIQLESSSLRLYGSADDVVTGGQGGQPFDVPGEFGASASALVANNSEALWSGVSFQTFDGVPALVGAGISQSPIAVPVLAATGSGLLGESITLELSGPASAPYLLWVSPFAGYAEVGAKPMPLLLSSPLLPLATGALGTDGAGSLPVALPVLPELLGVPVHFQAFVKPATGAGLSTGASLVLR